MNHTAVIDYNRPEGYVVCWTDEFGNKPLRNFGDYKSAAIEFRDYINRRLLLTDDAELRIKGWIKSYDPERLYSYPEIKGDTVTLKKQKT